MGQQAEELTTTLSGLCALHGRWQFAGSFCGRWSGFSALPSVSGGGVQARAAVGQQVGDAEHSACPAWGAEGLTCSPVRINCRMLRRQCLWGSPAPFVLQKRRSS